MRDMKNELWHQINRVSNSALELPGSPVLKPSMLPNAGDTGLIPGWGTRSTMPMQRGKNKTTQSHDSSSAYLQFVLSLGIICLGRKWTTYITRTFWETEMHSLVEMKLAYYSFLSLWVSGELFSLLHFHIIIGLLGPYWNVEKLVLSWHIISLETTNSCCNVSYICP